MLAIVTGAFGCAARGSVAPIVGPRTPSSSLASLPAVPAEPRDLPVGAPPERRDDAPPDGGFSMEPRERCAPGLLWDGADCVAPVCGPGAMFREGHGCARCIGECDDPLLVERAVVSEVGPPFARAPAREALRAAGLATCVSWRTPGWLEVALAPNGTVRGHRWHPAREAPTDDAHGCFAELLAGARLPPFRGATTWVDVALP